MTFLLETIRLGLTNLRLHLLRSVLTSLGIILGVAAVIVMVAIGEGNKQAALREIQALGATNIIVRSSQPPETGNVGSQARSFTASYGLLRRDMRRLEHALNDIEHIVPLKAVGSEVLVGAQRMSSQSFGTTPELRKAANLRIERGRYLSETDMQERAPVAVIGDDVARRLFPLSDPLGATIRIDEQVLTVVGVLQQVGLAGRDWNKDVHLPLTTAEVMFGDEIQRRESGSFSRERVELAEIYITAATTDAVIGTSQRIQRILEVDHPNLRDVSMIVPWQLLESKRRTQMVWNIVLISIAAISLLVGGIGIMNIMLASVTERTREIGIRRALGATRKHIVAQFLVETGSLSAVGGLLGIALGVGLALAVEEGLPAVLESPYLQQYIEADVNVETQITTWSIVASFVVAAVVGLAFGIYPAIVASRQDPIVALRHD